ncbi:hypothetical protein [Paraglaciecola sp.]|uniref:hypothetical protein n=1 Tax=Paraglaciecola sp. TaxID=1920173 RepID=UPI0030F3FA7B
MTQQLTKVYLAKRKNPLDDFETLMEIGLQASRSARATALSNGVSFTFAQAGRVMKRNPDGSTQVIREMENVDNFPSLEADLCQG